MILIKYRKKENDWKQGIIYFNLMLENFKFSEMYMFEKLKILIAGYFYFDKKMKIFNISVCISKILKIL